MNDIQSTSPRAKAARRFSFDSASIWILTLTFALAAVAFIPSVTVPFLYTKVSILAIGGLIALVFYILARLTRGNLIVPPPALLGALWLVPLAYALSSLFSGAGLTASFFGVELEPDTFGFMLLLAAFATLAALAFRRTAQYRVFFSVGAIVLAVAIVLQLLFLILGHAANHTVSSSTNLLGSFMDFGMLVGLGVSLSLLALRFLRLSSRLRIVLMVGIAAGLMAVALVNSNTVWILIALVALGLFIESILRRRVSSEENDLEGATLLSAEEEHESLATTSDSPASSLSLVAPLVALVIALFFLIGGSTIGNALTTTFGTNVLDVRPSWQSTFQVGSHTYAAAPIFGSGPNTFGQQWLKFRDRSLNNTVFWNVDFTSGIGLIPTSFVTVGLLGALAWIAFIFLFLFFGLRALLFRAPIDPYARFTSVASFTGTLYVLALMVFAVPGPMVLIAGFLLAGIFISSLRYGGARQEWGIIFAKNPRVGFLVVFGLTLLLLASVVASYVVIERYLADRAYAQASVALSKGDVATASTNINRSILFAPSDRGYQLAAEAGILQMNKIAGDTTLSPTQAQQQFQSVLSTSIQAALTATKLAPNNYLNWIVLGNVYQTVVPLNIDGAYQNAVAAYQHAITLDPTDPTLPYTLAQLAIVHKDAAAAQTQLQQAISLKPDYTQAIFLLSQLEVQEGKAKEALQAAEAAAYFSPNDPSIQFQVGILRSANGDTNGAIQALSQAVSLNPQYANAHYFLGVMYAIQAQYPKALAELQAVAALSAGNSQAVAADIAILQQGKNPFPPSRLGALGIPQPQLNQPTATNPSAAATAGTTGK
ncbi:tetratricopeptide repeat protein [Patescibacteria group bacterium]|nr:tetratricopeptide repeat protein [Patescibacteria group bacterium]